MKTRLYMLLFTVLAIGLTLYEWYAFRSGQLYSPAAAVAGPLGVMLFGAFTFFPTLARKATPEEKVKRTIQTVVPLAGLALGFLNLYVMTH